MKKALLFVSFLFAFWMLSTTESKAQSDTTFSINTSANPFDDQLVINIIQGNKHITGLKIFDAIGKEVSGFIPTQIVNKGNLVSFYLDFTLVKPGVYFCSIYSDKGIIETRKLFRAAR